MTRSRWLFLAAAALTAGTARAATYPITARLTLAPRAEQHCLPLEHGEDCGVIDITGTAFTAVTERMFKAGGTPDLQLILTLKHGEVARVAGLSVELAVSVRVLSASGEAVEDLEVYGNGLMLEPSGLAHAEQAAADDAATRFERAWLNSSNISDYLVGKKIAPAAAVGITRRGDKNFWIAVGAGEALGGGDSDVSVAPALRVAASYRWIFAQVLFSHYSSTFEGIQTIPLSFSRVQVFRRDDSQLSTTDLGLEAGVVVPLATNLELRLGPGVHYLFGDGTFSDSGDGSALPPPESYSVASLTALASLSYSFIAFHGGPRVVIGAEGRGYFHTSVDLPTLGRSMPVVSSMFGAFIGIEWSGASGGAQ
jgi:hypothetical protein